MYRNVTAHPQIARISQGPYQGFERVVFPLQVITFNALPEDELEIYSCDVTTSLLAERLSCHQLMTGELVMH